MTRQRWFDRRFELGLDAKSVPELLGRLAAAPDRLAAAVTGLSTDVLTRRRDGKWSIQENVGHLLDLEPLWDQRLNDFDAGAAELHPADLENRKTNEAGHNNRRISDILADFRVIRGRIVGRIAAMGPDDLARTALHPRLRQPMSIVDLCYFVAEHDDHHLRTVDELKSRG